jgi:hypothetical protein
MSSIPVANFASCLGKYDSSSLNGSVVNGTLDMSGAVGTADISLNAGAYLTNSATFVYPQGTGNGFSYMGWFYPSGPEAVNATPLMDISTNSAYPIVVCCSGTNVSPCLSASYNNSWVTTQGTTGGTVNLNAWNFFAYTVCCSGNLAVQNLYLNTASVATSTTAVYNTTLQCIKTYVAYGTGAFANSFVGKVDDFRFYGRVVTPMEYRVLQGYNYGTNTGNMVALSPTLGSGTAVTLGTVTATSAQFIFNTTGTYGYVTVYRGTGGSEGGATTSFSINPSMFVSINNGTSYSWTDTTVQPSTSYTYSLVPCIAGTSGGVANTLAFLVTTLQPITVSTVTYKAVTQSTFSAAVNGILRASSMSNGIQYTCYAFLNTDGAYVINYICYAATATTMFVLAVGGGGGGASWGGGGGGAGGVVMMPILLPFSNEVSQTMTINVGAGGGAGVCSASANITNPTNGISSTIIFSANTSLNVTAWNGGSGGPSANGAFAGSGGGGGNATAIGGLSCNINNNYGNSGGTSISGFCGGGGGAGAAATTGINDVNGGSGGVGIQCFLPGISTFAPNGTSYSTYYWGGGGGGCAYNYSTTVQYGNGGLGGGGGGTSLTLSVSPGAGGGSALNSGSTGTNSATLVTSGNGGANTGGGGGGAWWGTAGAGGSGIVVLAFPQSIVASSGAAIYNAAQLVDASFVPVMNSSTLTTSAYSSSKGAFSCKLVNWNYFGPTMTLRSTNDLCGNYTQNFYADVFGNMTTGYGNTGIPVKDWLIANSPTITTYAYVSKWYNQGMDICFNSATQYALSSQPIYDVANQLINFGYTGAGGGVAAPQTNGYFSLPNGALPYGDTSYSYVIRHWNVPSATNAGFINGGTNDASTKNCLGIRTNGTNYYVYWAGASSSASSSTGVTNQAINVITAKYTSGVTSEPFYINGTLNTTGTLSGRTQTTGSNFIGVSNTTTTAPGNEYLNGQLYSVFVYNTSIDTPSQTSTEITPYLASTTLTTLSKNIVYMAPVAGSNVTISSIKFSWPIANLVNGTSASNGITYNVYSFTMTGGSYVVTYSCAAATFIYVLAVGGGGGGGARLWGGTGGGAGGVVMMSVTLPSTSSSSATVTVTVGAGGAGGYNGIGGQGNNTTVNFSANASANITAWGGGYGAPNNTANYLSPSSGGSGGGGTTNGAGASYLPGNPNNTYNNFGNIGGYYSTAYTPCGSCGGGAGTAATFAYVGWVAFAGNGIQCPLPGINKFAPSGTTYGTYYWGGGGSGAGGYSQAGLGGGGAGGSSTPGTGGITTGPQNANGQIGNSGGTNTGGGGGGTYIDNTSGGAGGSGIVVLAFPQIAVTSNAMAVLNSAQIANGGFKDVMTMQGVSTPAYQSIKGGFACRLLNYDYFGPVMTLRYSNDVCGNYTQNFYSDVAGNLGTQYLGTGVSVTSWLYGAGANITYAYVSKWYNQGMDICFNSATQYVLGSQPIYDVATGVMNFGYQGTGGGVIAPQTNAYFNLPNAALPYNDSSYSYVFKHYNTSVSTTGNAYLPIVSGGGPGNNTGCELGFFNNVYSINWFGSQVNLGTVTPNTVVATTYKSGAANNSAVLYANYGSGDISSSWTPGAPANTIRSQPVTTNYIGQGAWHTADKINSQVYYLYMFNTVLSSDDRLAIQATATPVPITVVNVPISMSSITTSGFTATWTNPFSSTSTMGATTTTYFVNGTKNTSVAATGTNSLSITYTNLTGYPFQFAIYIYNSVGAVVASGSAATPMSGFTISGATPTTLSLSWTALSTLAVSYAYNVTTNNQTVVSYTASGANPSTLTGLNTYGIYTVNVLGRNTVGGLATGSTTVTINYLVGIVLSAIGTAGFTVTWTSITGTVSYLLTLANGTTVITTPSSSANSYTFSGLTSGTAYIVNVMVRNGTMVSWAGVPITTSAPSASAPTAITGMGWDTRTYNTNVTPNSGGFRVYWSGGTGATSFTYSITYTAISVPVLLVISIDNNCVSTPGPTISPDVVTSFSPTSSGSGTTAVTFTGLTQATSGTFSVTVTATNANGSVSNTVTGCQVAQRYMMFFGAQGTGTVNGFAPTNIVWSTNGTTWNSNGALLNDLPIKVAGNGYYGNGTLMMLTLNQSIRTTSTGLSAGDWTTTVTNMSSSYPTIFGGAPNYRNSGLVYGNGRFVILMGSTNLAQTGGKWGLAYSTNNGTSWAACNISNYFDSNNYILSIAYGGGYFVCTTKILTVFISSDGVNFSGSSNTGYFTSTIGNDSQPSIRYLTGTGNTGAIFAFHSKYAFNNGANYYINISNTNFNSNIPNGVYNPNTILRNIGLTGGGWGPLSYGNTMGTYDFAYIPNSDIFFAGYGGREDVTCTLKSFTTTGTGVSQGFNITTRRELLWDSAQPCILNANEIVEGMVIDGCSRPIIGSSPLVMKIFSGPNTRSQWGYTPAIPVAEYSLGLSNGATPACLCSIVW